jgi:lipid A disaccharide synthetase
MSVFFTDQIVLIDVTTDENNVKEEYESAPQIARVEDFNQLITDSRGQEVKANMVIFTNTTLLTKYTDKIRILKKSGEDFDQSDKKWLIKKKPNLHLFSAHHKEIYI